MWQTVQKKVISLHVSFNSHLVTQDVEECLKPELLCASFPSLLQFSLVILTTGMVPKLFYRNNNDNKNEIE